MALQRLEGYGNAWHARNDGFHGSGDRPGVGHVMSQVCTRIDARDHQVNWLFEIPQGSQRHTIGWGTIAGERLRAICQTDLLDAQGAVQRFDMPASRPVPVWSKDAHLPDPAHFLNKSKQAWRQYAIIIRNENMFCHFDLSLSRKLLRFWAASTANTRIRSMITPVRNNIFSLHFV